MRPGSSGHHTHRLRAHSRSRVARHPAHSAPPPMPGRAEFWLKAVRRVAGPGVGTARRSALPGTAGPSWFWVSPKRYAHTLTLGTCECDLVWKRGLCSCETASSGALRLDQGGLPGGRRQEEGMPAMKETHRGGGHVTSMAGPGLLCEQRGTPGRLDCASFRGAGSG